LDSNSKDYRQKYKMISCVSIYTFLKLNSETLKLILLPEDGKPKIGDRRMETGETQNSKW